MVATLSETMDQRHLRFWVLWISLVTGFCAMFGGSLLALSFIHHRGVNLSGDEPSYVGEAYALGRLHTWNLGQAFASSGFQHLIGTNSSVAESVFNRGVQFPYHAIGFSAILAPSLALFDSIGELQFELFALMGALVIWLGFEVSRLTRTPRVCLLLVVLLFLAPGYLLATTQVYPDLISGLVLAVVVVRLMIVERDGTSGIWSSAITGALLFTFVWLDNKNIVIGILIGAFATLLTRRKGATIREVIVLAGLVLFGIAGVTVFNIYAYGDPVGPPQALTPFSGNSLTDMVALVFDRRHGILVQSPATLLGLVGAVRWWRRAPWSVTVGIATVAMLLVANASEGGMDGGSFVGRYEWEALALALAFGGMFLTELAVLRRRATTVVVGILLLLAILESSALFASRSNALSFISNGWDPVTYLGWWGRFDPSPILNYLSGEWANARNIWGLGTLVALFLVAAFALVRLIDGGGFRLTRIAIATSMTALLCWDMAISSPFLLPQPIQYAGSDLGPIPLPVPSRAITVDGSGHHGPIISGPNLEVLPGRYRVTVAYSLINPSSRSATFEVLEKSAKGNQSSTFHLLLPSSTTTTHKYVELNVATPGHISVALTWRGSGRLSVMSVVFRKIATCYVVECQGNAW